MVIYITSTNYYDDDAELRAFNKLEDADEYIRRIIKMDFDVDDEAIECSHDSDDRYNYYSDAFDDSEGYYYIQATEVI